MTVQETILEMMQTYPTMYRSRVQALARLFDFYSTHWEDGCLIDTDRPSSPVRNPLPYPNTLANPTTDKEMDGALFERGENAKAQFLERFRIITPCPYERAARVKELQREALALGLNLTEADGGPPKTSVI